MGWFLNLLNWYFYLFVLGIVFFPLAKKIFASFFDQGYAFAKTLAILLSSYAIFVLGVFKILPFTELSLFLIIALFLFFSLVISPKKKLLEIKNLPILFFEEGLFFLSLVFLTYIRGQEPSIRGLEKFMDFGFINSILKSKYFPPLDIWLSSDPNAPQGYPINYYYFGHLTGAFIIKLTGIKASIGYNLILATIFAQGVTLVFSLVGNLVYFFQKQANQDKKINYLQIIFFGLLAAFIVNLGGNLHTIYLFTTGYPNENPIPFWKILSGFNPSKYWYPNATRFIPFTIHEFPSYSYVVADLHGHVFDIPFVLLTLAVLLILFINIKSRNKDIKERYSIFDIRYFKNFLISYIQYPISIILGFLTAVHYMTNAFDGPIYILLSLVILFIIYKFSYQFFINVLILALSFIAFSLPFSLNFSPFVTGIGVNCAPSFLTNLQKIGPFLFEKGNCQVSSLWMMFILWGFFWANFIMFAVIRLIENKRLPELRKNNITIEQLDNFILILFSLSTFLIIIPEFFYIKDIYPAHFRANTIFKLGYQAFMMMGIASVYSFYRFKLQNLRPKLILKSIFLVLFFLIFLYPFFAFPSYYGKLDRPAELDGAKWLESTYPEDREIIDYLNENTNNQPTILEAQGDSYTDYERISAYTGLPTVAGWWVHEWLWRGSSDVVGKKIPDVINLYESRDIEQTKNLIKKYHIKYIIVSKMEREKYKNINEEKFNQIGNKIFESTNKIGVLYQVN